MKFNVASLLAFALAGCGTTVSDVVPIGNNAYAVTSTARGGLNSDAEVKALAIQQADVFCATQGKHAEVILSHATGVPMWMPQNSEVQFICVKP